MSNRQAVSLYFLINGFLFANWAARLPHLQEVHLLDHRGISFVLLAHSIGAFLAMPVTGWLIDKFSSRRVTLWAGLFFPVWFITIPFVNGFAMLLIPFALMGMSAGVMDVSMNAQAVEVEKDLGKPIMTNFHAMFSIGMVIGGLSAGQFLVKGAGLTPHFMTVGVIGFLVLLLASKYLFKDVSQSAGDEPLFVFPKGLLVGLGVIAFCCMMGEGAMADWSTNYMKRVVKADLELQTMGLTAFASLMTVGRLLGDRGRSQLGDKRILLLSAGLSLIGICLILSLVDSRVVIVGFGLVGLGLSNIVPIIFSLSGDIPGVKPGVGIAMASTIGYTGFMFGPPIIGFIADAFNLRIALSLLFWLFLIMTILIISYKRKQA